MRKNVRFSAVSITPAHFPTQLPQGHQAFRLTVKKRDEEHGLVETLPDF